MDTRDAVALIATAVGEGGGIWADIGAGSGTFTRALAQILAAGSAIYAVDRDARAVAALRESATAAANLIPVQADFTRPFDLPGLGGSKLDGIVLANALHFAADAQRVLTQLVERLRVGGRVVLVEYERRAASRWVPYPIPVARWEELAQGAGLSTPIVTARQPSMYDGVLYVAAADRIG